MTTTAPNVGDAAPDLQLPTLDGGAYDLRAAVGQFVVVSFLRHAG